MGGTWSRLWAVSRTASRTPDGRTEGHGPDAGQRPGSSRAVRCGSLGGSGRADGRHLVTAPGGQENGQTAHQWAARGPRAGCRAMAEQRAMLPWSALWLPMCPTWTQSAPRAVLQIRTRLRILGAPGRAGGRAPGPSSGRSSGRPNGPPAGRAEGSGAGCLAEVGQLRRGAVHLPGRLWPSGWAAPGHSSGQSGGRPDGPTVGRQRATGRTLGRSQAAPARRAALPWVALAIINPIFTVLIL